MYYFMTVEVAAHVNCLSPLIAWINKDQTQAIKLRGGWPLATLSHLAWR